MIFEWTDCARICHAVEADRMGRTGCPLLQAMRAALLVLGLLPSVLCEGDVELLGLAWGNMESMDTPPFRTLRS